ncbi:MAG: serine/threonine-protein kinase [Planctomycetaceae bacterium]
MAAYHYQQGDRPLDGFTIQYALGRGGFGEVYFAVSDSGREVALKAVQNFEEVELRGISHCMNLKSPQLVMIFDVKRAADGVPWVIMEYVSGPSLRDVLDESPNGLGVEQTKFFLKELARGLSYLHDAGVVHRDLKPHNVFFEDGIVKIGDYSLSKVITASHRSGNTMTVGSVHYMAPEISMGRYDKTVDIYALGVILYEMQTGQPPYVGESMGEVLMKHLSCSPDVSQLCEPFASAVVKAMQRDPADRFQTAQQMAEAVCGPTALLTDERHFNPATLSLIGERARAARASVPASGGRKSSGVLEADNPRRDLPRSPGDFSVADSTAPTLAATRDTNVQTQTSPSRPTNVRKLLHRMCLYYLPPDRLHDVPDPLPWGLRLLMATVVTLLLITVSSRMQFDFTPTLAYFFAVSGTIILTASLTTHLSVRTLPRHGGIGWALLSRFCWTFPPSFILTLYSGGHVNMDFAGPLFFGLMVSMYLFDWRCMVAPHRTVRLSMMVVLAIGAIAVVYHSILSDRDDWTPFAAAVAMSAAITVQMAAPYRKAAPDSPALQSQETR